MSHEQVPASISTAVINIAGFELVVHNLDNGQRVIEREGMEAIFEAMAKGRLLESDAEMLVKVIRS